MSFLILSDHLTHSEDKHCCVYILSSLRSLILSLMRCEQPGANWSKTHPHRLDLIVSVSELPYKDRQISRFVNVVFI